MLTIAPERLDEADPAQLPPLALAEAETVLPGLTRGCEHWMAQPIARKTPLFGPGYGLAARAFRERQAISDGGIVLCGDYLTQPLLGGAVRSGEEAATVLAARLASRSALS